VQTNEIIKAKHSHIFCKVCDKPFVNPIMCNECCEFVCFKCKNKIKVTEEDSCVCSLTDNWREIGDTTKNLLMNGKGNIKKPLENLEIYCPLNRKYGCKWQGTRKNYTEHLSLCGSKYLDCIYGCGDRLSLDNIDHYDECKAFSSWIDFKSTELDKERTLDNLEDRKIVKYMQYTNNKIKELSETQDDSYDDLNAKIYTLEKQISKISVVLKAYHKGNCIADFNKSQTVLCEVMLPDEDSIWSINFYTCYSIYVSKINHNGPTLYKDDFLKASKEKAIESLLAKYNIAHSPDLLDYSKDIKYSELARKIIEKRDSTPAKEANYSYSSDSKIKADISKKTSELKTEYQELYNKMSENVELKGSLKTNIEYEKYYDFSKIKALIQMNLSGNRHSVYDGEKIYILKKGLDENARKLQVVFESQGYNDDLTEETPIFQTRYVIDDISIIAKRIA
jgi:hypothetical protein